MSNKKFYFTKCSCAQVFRGENFKGHMEGRRVTGAENEEKSHGPSMRLLFCLVHLEILRDLSDEQQKMFHARHRSCAPPLHLLKKEMEGLFEGVVPKKRQEKVVEKKEGKKEDKKEKNQGGHKEDQHKVDLDEDDETETATANLVAINKRAREETDSSEEEEPVTKKKKRVATLEDSSEEEEVVGEPVYFGPTITSTPEEGSEDEKARKAKEQVEEARKELKDLMDELAVSDSEAEEGEVSESEKEKDETPEERARREKEQLKADRRAEMAEERRLAYERKENDRKQKEWSKEHAAEITQKETFVTMSRKLDIAKKARDEALAEKAKALKQLETQQLFADKYSRLMVEKRQWEGDMAEIRKERDEEHQKAREARKEKAKAQQETERVKEELEDEREGRRRAEEESSRLENEVARLTKILEERKKPIEKVRIVGHLACRAGRVRKSLFEVEDLNKTMSCFSDKDTVCHHVFLTRDDQGGVICERTQNTKHLPIGKKHCL